MEGGGAVDAPGQGTPGSGEPGQGNPISHSPSSGFNTNLDFLCWLCCRSQQ